MREVSKYVKGPGTSTAIKFHKFTGYEKNISGGLVPPSVIMMHCNTDGKVGSTMYNFHFVKLFD